jgi:monoamine oxidase
MGRPQYDVVVIGAGAAGLAAAAELARAKASTLVVEARERAGGRCRSIRIPGVPVPLELGAEFIHGDARATRAILHEAGSATVDAPRRPWIVHAGRLERRADYLPEIQSAMKADRSLGRRDMSFEDFLKRALRPRVSEEACAYARMLVQGYDAADPERVSARAIVEEWTSEGANTLARPFGGYGALIDHLFTIVTARGITLKLQTVVERVHWKRDRVAIEGQSQGVPFAVTSRRALITLPAGVLQARGIPGAVKFRPDIREQRRALRRIGVGPVVKVVFHFHRAFWEELENGRYGEGTFFHCPGAVFPTIWTAAPVRVPILVAWAGGPNAMRLYEARHDDITRRALGDIGRVFAREMRSAELIAAYAHDWQQDPYARGAYTYVKTGGDHAREALASAVASTLYFAGEATDVAGEAGTVAGALQSGQRAARELLRKL